MAIQTATQKENLAIAYGTNATYAALYTTAPGASAGTEPSGGSPAYARKALTWVPGSTDGVNTATVTSAGLLVAGGARVVVSAGTVGTGAVVVVTCPDALDEPVEIRLLLPPRASRTRPNSPAATT